MEERGGERRWCWISWRADAEVSGMWTVWIRGGVLESDLELGCLEGWWMVCLKMWISDALVLFGSLVSIGLYFLFVFVF